MSEQQSLPLAPDTPPASAADALARLDMMMRVTGLWKQRTGLMAELMGAWNLWLHQMRPHLEAAAERSNAHD